MSDVLRGTVYVVVNGVPVGREILALPVDTVEQFQAAARTRMVGAGAPAGATFEFGPIGPPWGLLGA